MNFSERQYWSAVTTLAYVGARLKRLPKCQPRHCNICRYVGPFGPGGKGTRKDARCPRCRSVERDRLFKLWLDDGVLAEATVLHFAPEKALEKIIRAEAAQYLSADIAQGRADIVLDIEAIDASPDSIDAIICSHVLEHVDDRKALSEMFRILRPGGRALILVPIVEGWCKTYENPVITEPGDRMLHFGQSDHLRYYGADIRDRITAAGFVLSEFTANPQQVIRHGLIRGETIFIATKPE